MNSTESSFPKEVVPPLELLAAECLRTRHYGRLHVVVDLLAIFSRELLETLADEKKEEFVRQMRSISASSYGERNLESRLSAADLRLDRCRAAPTGKGCVLANRT